MNDDMVGFSGFGNLKGEHTYNQVVQKMNNFFRFVHNDEQLEIEFHDWSTLANENTDDTFTLISINYDRKKFKWKWIESYGDNFGEEIGEFSNIRMVTDSEPSYNDIKKCQTAILKNGRLPLLKKITVTTKTQPILITKSASDGIHPNSVKVIDFDSINEQCRNDFSTDGIANQIDYEILKQIQNLAIKGNFDNE